MKLCANGRYGPIQQNTEDRWSVIHIPSGEDISYRKIFYVDDETGEFWQFVELDEPIDSGRDFKRKMLKQTENGDPVIEKHVLGPGKLRVVKRDA